MRAKNYFFRLFMTLLCITLIIFLLFFGFIIKPVYNRHILVMQEKKQVLRIARDGHLLAAAIKIRRFQLQQWREKSVTTLSFEALQQSLQAAHLSIMAMQQQPQHLRLILSGERTYFLDFLRTQVQEQHALRIQSFTLEPPHITLILQEA